MWAYMGQYIRHQGTEFVSKESRECSPFIALLYEIAFSFFISLLSMIVAKVSEITEKQSGFSGKITDGDG